MFSLSLLIVNLLLISAEVDLLQGQCEKTEKSANSCQDAESPLDKNLIFYDVNSSEGFNLRRDVYMRLAIMLAGAHERGYHKKWQLVLPPWYRIVHWKTEQKKEPLPWSKFFDIDSMKSYAPVLDMYEVFEGNAFEIDTMFVLMNYRNAFENGDFKDRWEVMGPCEVYGAPVWGYTYITVKEIICVFFQGHISQIWDILSVHPRKNVMFYGLEVALHDQYGTKAYWDCRKSMKFNKKLVKKAKSYMADQLNCSTEKCYNYIAIHWRRRDFARYRKDDVPSIIGTAQQIHKTIVDKSFSFKDVFIATDAELPEKLQLEANLEVLGYKAHFFVPSEEDLQQYREGGVAIIDQIICSHAAYFIGTHESTFSFRIQEEREILGFSSNTTFNRLCPDTGKCERPSKWTLVNDN